MDTGPKFETHREHLFKLAYRLLGSVADAEDVVQDAYLRWCGAQTAQLDQPRAWLTTVCTRLCLDRMRRLQAGRDEYVGEWLPEPLLETPEVREIDESVLMALLVTMQKLKPSERAVFLLHDVFGYKFQEVAAVLELEPDNCRQLAVRARRHLAGEQVRGQQTEAGVVELSDAFFAAVKSGELQRLEATLAEDVVFRADGGGKASASRRPLFGVQAVARFLYRVLVAENARNELVIKRMRFNGSPGVVLFQDGAAISAFQFEVRDDRIASIHVQRNPDKLTRFGVS